MNENSIVLKQDVRGRVITPVERRLALVAEFERSGLSGAQFAKLAGVQYATFMNWVARKRGKVAASRAMPPKPLFVEAVATGAADSLAVIVELGGGARISLRDARQVPLAAQLLNALQQQHSPLPC